MNLKLRKEIVTDFMAELRRQTFVAFLDYPVCHQREDKLKQFPSEKYQFFPAYYHLATSTQNDRKSVGLSVDVSNSGPGKNGCFDFECGFEIVHHVPAGRRLKKALETEDLIIHLVSLKLPRVYRDSEYSRDEPAGNLGCYSSRSGDFRFCCSGLGGGSRVINLSGRDGWIEIAKSYPWVPGRHDAKAPKKEKTYFTLVRVETLDTKTPARRKAGIRRIVRRMLKAWMPLLDGCAVPRGGFISSSRPSSEFLRNQIARYYKMGRLCCAKCGIESVEVAHIVGSKEFKGCSVNIVKRSHSSENLLALCSNHHKVQEKVEEWFVGRDRQIYTKLGKRVSLPFISNEHRQVLRDLRCLSSQKRRGRR